MAVGLDGRIRENVATVSRRYEASTGDQAIVNKAAYASFAFELASGGVATFPPVGSWPEQHF